MKLAKELGIDMSAVKPEMLDALVVQLEDVAAAAYEGLGGATEKRTPAHGENPWWDLLQSIEKAPKFKELLHKAVHALDILPRCSAKVTMMEVVVVFGVELAKAMVEAKQLEVVDEIN